MKVRRVVYAGTLDEHAVESGTLPDLEVTDETLSVINTAAGIAATL